jgi:hypothetical protein
LAETTRPDRVFCGFKSHHLHNTIVDFLVEKQGTKLLIEVKPKSMLDIWNNPAKIKAIQKFCKSNNFEFSIWTESNLHP